MRTLPLLSLFIVFFFGISVLAVTETPFEHYDCAETLTHFTSFDMSIERPLEEIFEKHAFEILPLGSKKVEPARLANFYDLIKAELLRSDRLSIQLSKWVYLEQALADDERIGYASASPAADVIHEAVQAFVVIAVANDLLPYVRNQETQYKLVFASLIFSQRVDPTKWKVKLRFVLDPRSRAFIRTMGLTHYRLYYFLQKGPWTGRHEVLRHELGLLKVRTTKTLKKTTVDSRLRPYVEQMLGEHAAYIRFTNSP